MREQDVKRLIRAEERQAKALEDIRDLLAKCVSTGYGRVYDPETGGMATGPVTFLRTSFD